MGVYRRISPSFVGFLLLVPPHFEKCRPFLKSRVYRTQVSDLDDLRHRIHDAIDGITEEILKNTWRELQKRLDFVAENGGRHCELR